MLCGRASGLRRNGIGRVSSVVNNALTGLSDGSGERMPWPAASKVVAPERADRVVGRMTIRRNIANPDVPVRRTLGGRGDVPALPGWCWGDDGADLLALASQRLEDFGGALTEFANRYGSSAPAARRARSSRRCPGYSRSARPSGTPYATACRDPARTARRKRNPTERAQPGYSLDEGWRGPQFDPIELASIRGIVVRPNAAVADARVFWVNGRFEIEYNPHRPRGRVNFSIAHEIAHTVFDDCSEDVRHRSREKWDQRRWQLELLCNVGAAEITMPVGSFPSAAAVVVTIEELMTLRKNYQVSAEAILIRLVKLASSRVACLSATRMRKGDRAWYRIDYRMDRRIGRSGRGAGGS